jgi:hypothetical protein
VDTVQPPNASTPNDCRRRGRHLGTAGQDSEGTMRSFFSPNSAYSTKYFKSIERVGNELGFRQKLPRKRDSLISEVSPPVSPAEPAESNSLKLTVPQFDISRSASPVLEPMSARLSDDEVPKTLLPMEVLEDSPTTRMSARVLG